MFRFATILFLAVSTLSVADETNSLEGKTLQCHGKSTYLGLSFSPTLRFGKIESTYLGSSNEGENVVFSWSQTECEDLSSLKVKAKDLKAYLSGEGKRLFGEFEHSDPDVIQLKLAVECELTN